MGAALTAHLLGVPAVAISLDASPAGVAHWGAAAWALDKVVRLWQANPEPTPHVFNVNVPNLPASHLAGTLVTAPTNDSCLTKYRFMPDPHLENTIVATRDRHGSAEPAPWTDAWALQMGYIAITPLRVLPELLCMPPWGIPPEVVGLPTRLAPDLRVPA